MVEIDRNRKICWRLVVSTNRQGRGKVGLWSANVLENDYRCKMRAMHSCSAKLAETSFCYRWLIRYGYKNGFSCKMLDNGTDNATPGVVVGAASLNTVQQCGKCGTRVWLYRPSGYPRLIHRYGTRNERSPFKSSYWSDASNETRYWSSNVVVVLKLSRVLHETVKLRILFKLYKLIKIICYLYIYIYI